MTREQVRNIIGEGATDEMINALLNLHSADIGSLRQTITERDNTIAAQTQQLTEVQNTIATLQSSAGDIEAMRGELERYQTAERERTEQQQREQAEAQLRSRFDAVTAETKFVNDLTRDGVFAQFRAAVADAANAGKGDASVLADLLKDKTDLLANPNPAVNIPGAAPLNNQQVTAEAFKSMPLHEQMAWANANPEMYARMSDMLKKGR